MGLFQKRKKQAKVVDIGPLVQKGQQDLQASRWRDAITGLESATEASPGDPIPHGLLCQAYARSGNGAAAIEHFVVYRKADPATAARLAEQDQWLISGKDVKPLGTSQRDKYTYESYVCSDASVAKEFLANRDVDRPNYYVDVETPDGIWGCDINGLYQARLPQWKTDMTLAECDGDVGIPKPDGLQLCVKGISDNFVVDVSCGRCQHSWLDAVRYQDTTVVRCPSCGAYNRVATLNINAVLMSE